MIRGLDGVGVAKSCSAQQLFLRDERGMAGIEFTLIVSVLCFLFLNGIDVARYAWIRMQVENAAQIGAQAAWRTCDPNNLPVSCKSSAFTTPVTAAIQSTSLQTAVTLQTATAGYYCVDAAVGLKLVADTTPPSNCQTTGRVDLTPGYYAQVGVSYTYAPLFADLTIARLFSTLVTKTARVRLL
jgi:Flp pilus assembly protein TadG